MHFRRARGKLVIGQLTEAMPDDPHGVVFATGCFKIHFPAMNHVRIDGALVGEQHEIFRARLVALGVDGGEVFGRTHAGSGDDARARLGHKILQRLQPLFHFGVKSTPLVGVGCGLISGLQCRFRPTAEDTVQRIIIRRRNGVVLVVMTARAGDREPHQPARGDVDAVVENIVNVAREPRAKCEKTKRSQRRLVVAVVQTVGGELLDDELVKRLVVIQRANDIIAIRPRPREGFFLEKNVALVVRVAGNIEPMPRPMLAVARRGEKFCQCGIRIAECGIGFWREAREREMGAAVQHVIRGAGRGFEVGGLELGEDESVDGILHPRLVLHARWFGVTDGLEGPVRSLGPRGFAQ